MNNNQNTNNNFINNIGTIRSVVISNKTCNITISLDSKIKIGSENYNVYVNSFNDIKHFKETEAFVCEGNLINLIPCLIGKKLNFKLDITLSKISEIEFYE